MKRFLKVLLVFNCLLITGLMLNTNLFAQNYCVSFDGNDYATLGSGLCDTFIDGTAITIEFWFRGTSINSAVRLQNGNSPYIIAGWSYSGNIAFSVSNDGHVVIATPAALQDGNWHHVACTWQANTANGMKTYVDGVFQNQRTTTAAGLPDVNGGGYLGCYAGSSEYINGKLDEVRIWNIVRDQTEIQQNMGVSLTGSESGLIAYYKMNQTSGTVIDDATSHNYDSNFGTYPEYAPDWSSLDFSGGYGSADVPWQIANLTDLGTLSTGSSYWDECFLQTADIDASGTATWNSNSGWSPIGNDWDHAFYGVYSGGDHSITGLTINRNSGYQAFIGAARDNCAIQNLTISDATISMTGDGNSRAGVLVGEFQGDEVSNCHATGTVEGDGNYVGGLIGSNGQTISNCSFSGTISDDGDGSNYYGGLVGYNTGTIEDSYTSVSIIGNWYVGGLVGYNNAGTINSCYSTTPDGDNVFGNYHIGGLVGQNYGSASIIKSYSTATVVGYVNYAGGLVGSNNNSTISNCYSRGSVSRSQDSNGDFGSFVGKNENTTEVTYCYSTGEVIYQNATNPTDKGFVGNYNATGYSYNFFDSETTKQSSGAGATAKDTDAMKGITPGNTLTDWGWSTDTWERIGENYPRLKDNPDPTLPIILSAFTAQLLENTPTIYWETQSEVDNMGWFVYRSDEYDFSTSKKISEFIEGHGTTTQQQTYLYEDRIQEPEVGDAYYYWLESIDYSGMINHYDRVAVLVIPDQSEPPQHITPPQVSELRAEPNPFIKSTRISFMLSETSIVDVSIYNIKGELVKSYTSQQVTAGNTAFLSWDGRGDNGKTLPVGIYLYKLQVNSTIQDTRRVILIR